MYFSHTAYKCSKCFSHIAPFFIKHLPKTIDVMQGVDVRLDCILRRGIELIRWSTSPDVEKTKKDLADEGYHGEFIPMSKSSQVKEERKTGTIAFNSYKVF